MVIEGIGPQHYLGPALVSEAALFEPLLEGLGSKDGNFPLGCNTSHSFDDAAEKRCMRDKIDCFRDQRGEPRPPVDQSHGVTGDRSKLAFVIVREKLGLVSSHVNVDRTVTFAAFAGQAQVQCILHCFTAPPIFKGIALQHFKEQARSTTCRVRFFSRDHEAWTHGAAFHPAAPAYADTA